MKKIREVFVVEGKNDTAKLKSIYECDTIETGGSALDQKTLRLIAAVREERGIILFTDPDSSGERLRTIINEKVPGCHNAFLRREECRTSRKVGIEHASSEVIEKALGHLLTYGEEKKTISMSEYSELGLNGGKDAVGKRERLAEVFHLGHANAKTCFKRLNMLGKTKKDCLEALGVNDE